MIVKKRVRTRIQNLLHVVARELRDPKWPNFPSGDQSVINERRGDIRMDFIPAGFYALGGDQREKLRTMVFHHDVEACNIEEKLKQIAVIRALISRLR